MLLQRRFSFSVTLVHQRTCMVVPYLLFMLFLLPTRTTLSLRSSSLFASSNLLAGHYRRSVLLTKRNMASSATGSTLLDGLSGKTLVNVEECMAVHGRDGVVFIDGSWFLKGRNGRQEYLDGPRIEGGKYFDIDDISSKNNPKGLPHMMPSKELFAAAMDAMGITNQDHLIVYGSQGCLFPHRAWYQLRAMGHAPDLVHYMQGSLEDWKLAGGPVEEGPGEAIVASDLDLTKETSYVAIDAQNIVDMEEVMDIVQQQKGDSDAILVDVRAKERFLGQVEEPRPGMRLGHMPGAINLPFTDLLRQDNVVQFKPIPEMLKIMEEVGIQVDTPKRIVCSCGSGATACALALALTACGRDACGTYLYDGSWSEWGAEPNTPVVKQDD